MQTAEHDHKVMFSMRGWPGPLYFPGKGEEWLISSKYRYLSRVHVLNCCLDDGHGMSYHCHRVCAVYEQRQVESLLAGHRHGRQTITPIHLWIASVEVSSKLHGLYYTPGRTTHSQYTIPKQLFWGKQWQLLTCTWKSCGLSAQWWRLTTRVGGDTRVSRAVRVFACSAAEQTRFSVSGTTVTQVLIGRTYKKWTQRLVFARSVWKHCSRYHT